MTHNYAAKETTFDCRLHLKKIKKKYFTKLDNIPDFSTCLASDESNWNGLALLV
jgi:hypothetical protein